MVAYQGTPDNQQFSTTPVPIVVGVLNPANTGNFVWDCGTIYNFASMTTVVTGSPVSFTVVLEGTVDGTNWFTLITTTNVAGESQFSGTSVPFSNLRARCTAVSGGTSPTINVYAGAYASSPGPNQVPHTPNVLSGSATAANTAAAQTIITIPAGRTWYGTVSLVLTNQATTGTLVKATINTAGTGSTPAAATNILTVHAGTVGTVAGLATGSLTSGPFYAVAPAGNSITLTVTNNTATTCTSDAEANGVLL